MTKGWNRSLNQEEKTIESGIGLLLTIPIGLLLLWFRVDLTKIISYDGTTILLIINLGLGLFLFYHGYYGLKKQPINSKVIE